ncbi:hypothetical protein HGI30_09230 [Paenibacillus albicereus]|uniref:RCK N-terminal domain-containing protein n=1 Tax=Paenibacillus albicereus TaxID=2726185 RepID=A0A6H2GWH3_9BACL|nr:hypothetical protein [Paenibacillus albicereus]QJC51709.1 hypothetical protein HGI30_09230 [Paenibacillus albicereus]
MDQDPQTTLVSPATPAGERFLIQLQHLRMPCAAIVNSSRERKRLESLGIRQIMQIDTAEKDRNPIPDCRVGNVYLFESSLALCCRYVQICRDWTGRRLFVVTQGRSSRGVYQALGADHVIHTNGRDVFYLIQEEAGRELDTMKKEPFS